MDGTACRARGGRRPPLCSRTARRMRAALAHRRAWTCACDLTCRRHGPDCIEFADVEALPAALGRGGRRIPWAPVLTLKSWPGSPSERPRVKDSAAARGARVMVSRGHRRRRPRRERRDGERFLVRPARDRLAHGSTNAARAGPGAPVEGRWRTSDDHGRQVRRAIVRHVRQRDLLGAAPFWDDAYVRGRRRSAVRRGRARFVCQPTKRRARPVAEAVLRRARRSAWTIVWSRKVVNAYGVTSGHREDGRRGSTDHVDARGVSPPGPPKLSWNGGGRLSERAIAGDERCVERLGQRHVHRVVRREVSRSPQARSTRSTCG